jgi:hypothetical protein
MERGGWRRDGLNELILPKPCQARRPDEAVWRRRKKQAIGLCALTPSSTAQTLKKRCDARRGIDLNHAVQIADVDSQFQCAGRHDDAVRSARESFLRSTSLVDAERTMRHERVDIPPYEACGQILNSRSTVTEHEALFALMQPRNHRGCVLRRADVIELHVRFARRRLGRTHDLSRPSARANPPLKQLVRIADSRRWSHALDVAAREPHDALMDCEQMPSAIISCERMHFVDDDSLDAAKERLVFDSRRDQHDFERFRRGEQ